MYKMPLLAASVLSVAIAAAGCSRDDHASMASPSERASSSGEPDGGASRSVGSRAGVQCTDVATDAGGTLALPSLYVAGVIPLPVTAAKIESSVSELVAKHYPMDYYAFGRLETPNQSAAREARASGERRQGLRRLWWGSYVRKDAEKLSNEALVESTAAFSTKGLPLPDDYILALRERLGVVVPYDDRDPQYPEIPPAFLSFSVDDDTGEITFAAQM